MKMKKLAAACVAIGWVLAVSSVSHAALVWGVDPSATGNELVNIDPSTGAVNKSFSLSGLGIQTSNTKIGLDGGADGLYYTNADVANGTLYVIDPGDGSVARSFAIPNEWKPWNMDGLAYYANGSNAWLYASGCQHHDIHRYKAADGAFADADWWYPAMVDAQSIAGDNSGKIFVCAMPNLVNPPFGIYEVDPLNTAAAPTFLAGSPAQPGTHIVGMAYDGTYLYLSDSGGGLYTMDGSSGELVNTVSLDHPLFALGCTPGTCNVPAPGALLLAGLGVVLVGVVRSRWATA
jgi:hypothetical protein